MQIILISYTILTVFLSATSLPSFTHCARFGRNDNIVCLFVKRRRIVLRTLKDGKTNSKKVFFHKLFSGSEISYSIYFCPPFHNNFFCLLVLSRFKTTDKFFQILGYSTVSYFCWTGQ